MLSVIIPAYNAEKEISNCIDNILNTNTCEFEIIIVNDGSSDQTKETLDYYASKDNRIKAIHQSNQGVSKARNVGIEAALGDYIIFVDADDYLEDHALDTLLNILKKTNVDILEYSVCINSISTKSKHNSYIIYPDIIFSNATQALNISVERCFYCVWNKAYKTSLIQHKFHFPIGIAIGEDSIFNAMVFENQPSIASTSVVLYNHITGLSSAVTKFVPNYEEIISIKKKYLSQLFISLKIDKYPHYYNMMLGEYKFYINNLFHTNCPLTKKEIIKSINKTIYLENGYFEIKKAQGRNKTSKIFQRLVFFSNPVIIFLFYQLKKDVKNSAITKNIYTLIRHNISDKIVK